MNTWITNEGYEIEYKDLTDSHLLNIEKFIKRRAREGVVQVIGTLADPDSFLVDEIFGEDVLKHFNYEGIVEEIKRRNLKL